MSNKEKVWKIFILIIGIIIILCGVFAVWYVKHTKTLEAETIENNDKEENNLISSSDYFPDPDRIVYKIKKENKYYIFEKDEQSYKEILQEFYKAVNSKTEGEKLSEEDIKQIKNDEMFVEFDYNQISKNFIFPLDLEGKNMIAMQEDGGQVYMPKIENEKIKEVIEKNKKEYKGPYQLEEPRVYTSKNKEQEVKDPAEMRKIEDNLYELKIDNYQDYTEFIKKHNVEIDNLQISEISFNYCSVIATISKYYINDVTSDVGRVQYYYTGKVDSGTAYKVSITFVSKVANANCIYRNLDKVEVVQPNDTTNNTQINDITNKYTQKEISSEEAVEIWKKKKPNYWTGMKVIDVENYNKLEGIEKGEQAPNNLFIKSNNYPETAIGEKRPVWILHTAHDTHMLEYLDVYIDRITGEIIGGRVYGD